MAQYSIAVNNARLEAIEATVGTAAKVRLYTGAAPANCAAAATGTLLVEMILPSDWMTAAASASKVKLGTWSGAGVAAGTVGYYRIVDSGGTVCGVQGLAGLTGSGQEMILDNTNVAVAQVITVNTYTINAANL